MDRSVFRAVELGSQLQVSNTAIYIFKSSFCMTGFVIYKLALGSPFILALVRNALYLYFKYIYWDKYIDAPLWKDDGKCKNVLEGTSKNLFL